MLPYLIYPQEGEIFINGIELKKFEIEKGVFQEYLLSIYVDDTLVCGPDKNVVDQII